MSNKPKLATKLNLLSNMTLALSISAIIGWTGSVSAADDAANLERLGTFRSTGTAAGDAIAQHTAFASNVRANITSQIRLPKGFKIDLFAVVPDARQMAVSPHKGTVWVGTRKTRVWQATDRDMDNVADTVTQFSPAINFDMPNGVCYSADGYLYVVERNRVLMFPAADVHGENPDTIAIPLISRGELIPATEESYNHSARVCKIGPDDKLYISLGQPYNVTPPDKIELYKQTGIGGLIRVDRRSGEDREIIARGIRNSQGHAFNPVDGSLWFTDNQVDGMGDDTPPGELNRVAKAGQWYGHPYYGGSDVRTQQYQDADIPAEDLARYVAPEVTTEAHGTNMGLMFYTGNMFPEKYRNAIFSTQHGSWNRTEAVGARILVTYLDENGNATKMEPFAEGWLTEAGNYLGQPVDVAQYVDGSLLVSDDKAGVIYRISYRGEQEQAASSGSD